MRDRGVSPVPRFPYASGALSYAAMRLPLLPRMAPSP